MISIPPWFCSQNVSFLNDFCCFNYFLLRSLWVFSNKKTALWEEVVGLFLEIRRLFVVLLERTCSMKVYKYIDVILKIALTFHSPPNTMGRLMVHSYKTKMAMDHSHFQWLPSTKVTRRWKTSHLKMYLLCKIVTFQLVI